MDKIRRRGTSGRIFGALLVTTALVIGCSSGTTPTSSPTPALTPAPTQAASPTAAPQVVLNVTLDVDSWSTAIMDYVPEFEAATGITVNAATFSDDQIENQYNVKLNASSTDLDVMMLRPLQDLRLFYKNGWLNDMTTAVSADPAWDWNDFQPPTRSAVSMDSKVYGVPITTEQEVVMYRKDLLAEANLEVPKTLDEFRAAMEAITTLHPDIYGFVGRGQAATAVTQFSSYLYAFGGDWVDANGKSAVNSDAAKQAYAYYGGLLHDYGPPGASNLTWPDAMALFTQGKAAFFTEDDNNGPQAIDPAQSAVADKVGFAQMPAGPAGSHPYNITSFMLSISSYSLHKDAAWQFISWATSKEMVKRIQDKAILGARASVPLGAAFPADLAEVIRTESAIGMDHDRPQVINVGQARDIVGAPIVTAITGGDVNAAAETANTDFQALLDQEAGH